jgi:hypothetical protein
MENGLTKEEQDKTISWVDDNKDGFPNTLDGKTMYYADVKFTAEVWSQQLYSSDYDVQMTAYQNLKQLYRDLQVKENWNKPLEFIGTVKMK